MYAFKIRKYNSTKVVALPRINIAVFLLSLVTCFSFMRHGIYAYSQSRVASDRGREWVASQLLDMQLQASRVCRVCPVVIRFTESELILFFLRFLNKM
jgi:hypothetical protein